MCDVPSDKRQKVSRSPPQKIRYFNETRQELSPRNDAESALEERSLPNVVLADELVEDLATDSSLDGDGPSGDSIFNRAGREAQMERAQDPPGHPSAHVMWVIYSVSCVHLTEVK